jgi:hypothetical protein
VEDIHHDVLIDYKLIFDKINEMCGPRGKLQCPQKLHQQQHRRIRKKEE